jgi:hypothetical protein
MWKKRMLNKSTTVLTLLLVSTWFGFLYWALSYGALSDAMLLFVLVLYVGPAVIVYNYTEPVIKTIIADKSINTGGVTDANIGTVTLLVYSFTPLLNFIISVSLLLVKLANWAKSVPKEK